jgi:membrane-bound lytic murein transglycosylase B
MRKIFVAASFLMTSAFATTAPNPLENAKPFPITPEVQKYIDSTAKQYHFNKSELVSYFEKAKYLPAVIDRMNGPFEAKPWNYYRHYFVTPERVALGVEYWKKHEAALNKIAKRYNVAPQVIVAILGVETLYGTGIGKFPVWDTLSTLAFHYPSREVFFRKELTQYLLLTRHENLPVLSLTGSYAGALGIPQFMPSSYRNYGVSLDKNKKIDLFRDHETAMTSIANYLSRSGFKASEPVAMPVELSASFSARNIISSKATPFEKVSQLNQLGVRFKHDISPNEKGALIALDKTDSKEYWVAFHNFRAIMSYNPNINYAMAVYQLSEELKKAHEQSQTQHSA